MEEMLKIVYQNLIESEDGFSSGTVSIMNNSYKGLDSTMERLKGLLGEADYEEIEPSVLRGVSDVQEAAFIAGLAHCAKLLTNGRTDFFPNPEGGAA